MQRPFVVYCHLDIIGRLYSGGPLSCLTGWIVADQGYEVVSLGFEAGVDRFIRCNYPFHRGDMASAIKLAGVPAMTGFNLVLPQEPELTEAFSDAGSGIPSPEVGAQSPQDGDQFEPAELAFVALIASAEGGVQAWRFTLPPVTGQTRELRLRPADRLPAPPHFISSEGSGVSRTLENRLFDQLARERRLTLRLDLINKCNLRCVMCHYSDEAFGRRPAQRIAPEQFSSWFEPLAPMTREVVLSCGDEPLMSPHFETILSELASRDPEVRIQFCTNAMLMSERIARSIVAARVQRVMLSFDGVTSATLHRIRVGSNYRRILKNILGLKRERAKSGGASPGFVFNFVMLESNIHEAPLFVSLAKRLGGDAIDFRHAVKFDLYDIEHEMLENNKPKFNFYRERIARAAAASAIEVFIPPPFATAGRYDPSGDPACSLDEFEAELRGLGQEHEAAPPPAPSPVSAAPAEPPAHPRICESAHFFCDRPFSEVMIRDQRDVYPCPWHREKMGVLDGSINLQEIFFSENFRRLRLAMLDPHGAAGCAGCPIKANQLPTRRL